MSTLRKMTEYRLQYKNKHGDMMYRYMYATSIEAARDLFETSLYATGALLLRVEPIVELPL